MPNWVYNEIRFKSAEDCRRVAQLMQSKNSNFDFNKVIPIPEYLKRIEAFIPKTHVRALAYAFSKGKHITKQELKAAIKAAYPQIKEVEVTPPLDASLEYSHDIRPPYVLSQDDLHTLLHYANFSDYDQEIANYQPILTYRPKTYADYAELVKRALFETGSLDWYDWSWRHWGTKWNAHNVDIRNKSIYWETAWEPSVDVVMEIHKQTNIPLYYLYTEEQISVMAGEMIFNKQKTKIYQTDSADECYQLAAFMNVIDPQECRLADDDSIVYEEDDGWESAQSLPPKAILAKEFSNL